MRIAMRAVRRLIGEDGTVQTGKDMLDWLRYAKSETAAHARELAEKALPITPSSILPPLL